MGYQWRIYWANVDPIKGSEQSGTRPVLVISEDAVNEYLPVVTVICLASLKKGRKIYPIETIFQPEESQLQSPSIAMAHQMRTISKNRLQGPCGFINKEAVRERVRNIIRVYLGFK